MGQIVNEWCFTGLGSRSDQKYCTRAKIDTAADAPAVIPFKEAQRLGLPIRIVWDKKKPLPALFDGQGRQVPGEWFWLGGMSSRKHDCETSPVLVFGQRNYTRDVALIGNEELQNSNAVIKLSNSDGDVMYCRNKNVKKDLLAKVNEMMSALEQMLPKGDSTI